MLEQSPAARSSKAPSEISSWHDDASSSLATFSARAQITVNPQRARMGEHLRGKLESMIRERFENYLVITQTLQNDIGKLAALECELKTPPSMGTAQRRISISCNEKGTFFVYTVPDVSSVPGSPGPSGASSFSSQNGEEGSAQSPSPHVRDLRSPPPKEFVGDSSRSRSPIPDDGNELLRMWVKQVCEFGMSGRCHSLTALFHFGYTMWKQMLGCGWVISEVEEQHVATSFCPVEQLGSAPPAVEGLSKQECPTRALRSILQDAHVAADCERFEDALGLCNEGIGQGKEHDLLNDKSRLFSSSSAATGSADPPGGDGETDADRGIVWELLMLRISVQMRLQLYGQALLSGEELIALQPTCAEGYYWQALALQGLGRGQESLEALMSALEYEPQNHLFQQAFNSLFEGISGEAGATLPEPAVTVADASTSTAGAGGAAPVSVLQARRPRAGASGDALSTTTQATRLSSRSTTPTEVSEHLSHSSSNDSISVVGVTTFEDLT